MIEATIYRQKDGSFRGFEIRGHAGYAPSGSDIVCSAVSFLATNTINSIEQLTEDHFLLEEDEDTAFLKMMLDHPASEAANLLLSSLALGLQSMEDTEVYGKYIDLIYKEA